MVFGLTANVFAPVEAKADGPEASAAVEAAADELVCALGESLGADAKRVDGKDYLVFSEKGTKVTEITAKIPETLKVKITAADGNALASDAVVATGLKLEVSDSKKSASAIVVLIADTNGDGAVSALDYVRIRNHIMNTPAITDAAELLAADIYPDGGISALDYVRVRNMIMSGDVEYTVTFDTLGGQTIEPCTVKYGKAYSLPTAEGKGTFAGWFVKESGTVVDAKGDYWALRSEDKGFTLYPVFTSETEVSGMTVTATKDKLTFNIGKVGESGKGYYIYELGASEYWTTETQTGQFSNKVDTGRIVGVYMGQSGCTVESDRYDENGYDRIYKKYIVANGEDVAAGPVWVTDIVDKEGTYPVSYIGNLYDMEPAASKKGIVTDIEAYYDYYGANYDPVGLPILGLVAPNEIVDEETGEIIETRGYDYYHDRSIPFGVSELDPIAASKDYFEFISNGQYYYFSKSALYVIDKQIVPAWAKNIYTIGILTLSMYADQEFLPYYMQYPGMVDYVQHTGRGKMQGINTGNEIGANYWIAIMEFFAWRYAEVGLIDIVLGNELDFAGGWNVTADYSTRDVSMEEYTEEIYRTLRIGSLALNKWSDEMDMSLSFTHYWNKVGGEEGPYAYAPHDMIEYVLAKSAAEGNFNWGLTLHNYAYNLTSNDVFTSDIKYGMVTGDYDTTPCMTISNFEVLEQYLEQDYARYNGKLRHVYLTETGVNAGADGEKEQQRQAAIIAFHYYKISMLDCVVAWPYYRGIDNQAEGVKFGLWPDGMHQRLSDAVWIDIDKLSVEEFNAKYASYLKNVSLLTDEVDYADTLQVIADKIGIDYDWASAWKKYYDYDVKGNHFTVEPESVSAP